MSKSFDFCIEKASDPERSTIADRDFAKALEAPLYSVLEYFKDKKVLSFGNDNLSVTITYDPDADFQYFTYSCSTHDGTLMFVMQNMAECLNRVLHLKTCYSPTGYPTKLDGAEIHYTIGNFVVCNEYDEQFATKEKPWMLERTTVLLPIKYSFKDGD